MICSKLDISMNHRSPATATFKAQLVTETPAIEMEKKNVFEQDRNFETLEFLGFEKIAVAIGPPIPMSITWKVEAWRWAFQCRILGSQLIHWLVVFPMKMASAWGYMGLITLNPIFSDPYVQSAEFF